MNNQEFSKDFEEDPIKQEARNFCETIQNVISLVAQLEHDQSKEHHQRVEYAKEYLGELSPFRGHSQRFQLKVTAAEGVNSHLSKYGRPFMDNPGPTLVDEVRDISLVWDAERNINFVQVDFFIKEHPEERDAWLVIFGKDMEIEPFFPK